MVLEANRRTNLTAAKSLLELVTAHVLDSLAPLALAQPQSPAIDIGSGAGFPGVPAAIAFPNLQFRLLEPRRLRAEFLQTVVANLALSNVIVDQKSAGRGSSVEVRASAATVLMRAVAPPDKSLRLGLPMVRHRGMLLLYEGRAAAAGFDERAIAYKFDARIQVRRVRVPFLDAQRHVWIVRRT